MIEHIEASLAESTAALAALTANRATLLQVDRAAQTLIASLEAGGRVYSCGNGGSLCDAMHFAEELTGRYRKNRRALAATAISDPSHLTCVANDYGYDHVFSRYIEAHGRAGDCLVALSTSGTSPSILNALKAARALGVKTIGLTGRAGSPLTEIADVAICTPGGQFADRVQELHIKLLHILIELIERHFCPENY
jgi:D-sedoheptulose 7-phosphate isomerase